MLAHGVVVDPHEELERQTHHLVLLGYPALIGTSDRSFRSCVDRLQPPLDGAGAAKGASHAWIPFALVIPGVRPENAMPLTRQGVKAGYVDMRPVEPSDFAPLESLAIPSGPYLVAGVETGGDTLGVPPRDALTLVTGRGRSPLTIAEGIAVITAFPGILRAANCFQMAGSRRADKRIPSLWVTRARAPRLGWCFESVPHSWLGAASCSERIGAPAAAAEKPATAHAAR